MLMRYSFGESSLPSQTVLVIMEDAILQVRNKLSTHMCDIAQGLAKSCLGDHLVHPLLFVRTCRNQCASDTKHPKCGNIDGRKVSVYLLTWRSAVSSPALYRSPRSVCLARSVWHAAS